MKIKGIVEQEIQVSVNQKAIWNDKELIDFSLWDHEYDLRMKAQQHCVLTNDEVEVNNCAILDDEELVMDIDLVTGNIHVVPTGYRYAQVLESFYNQYIKDVAREKNVEIEMRGGSWAWKPWKNKTWLRVCDGDVLYFVHFESVAFRNCDEKLVVKLADAHFYKGYGWDQVHEVLDGNVNFLLPILEEGNVVNLSNSCIPNIDVSLLFRDNSTDDEKKELANRLIKAFVEFMND